MSQFYVGITDTSWYSLLREDYNNGGLGKQVNFWTPGTREFKAIKPGELFLFKVHNKKSTGEKGEIVGGGYFAYYEQLSIPDAWEKYGRGNGRESLQKMQEALKGMQQKNNMQVGVEIGCIILDNVFFLDKLIDEPIDWSKNNIEQMAQSEQLLQRDVRKYDEAPEWQLPEPGAFASAKSFRDKVVMPFVNKLKILIKNLTIQCVRLKEEVLQLRKEKKRLSDDVEFYKGKIKDMSDRTELLQEKADDLERVKRYAGAEQIDTIIRKVKEQERTEQQIRRYDRSYGTR